MDDIVHTLIELRVDILSQMRQEFHPTNTDQSLRCCNMLKDVAEVLEKKL